MAKFQGVDSTTRPLLTEEQRMIRDTVREWVDDNLLPVINDAYIGRYLPKQLVPGMAELGVFGANLPEEYGCAGLDNVAYGLIMQELERGDSGIRSFASVQGALCMYPIYAFGSEEQKRDTCRHGDGEVIGASPHEPDSPKPAGWSPRQRRRRGVLNGHDVLTNAPRQHPIIWAQTGELDDSKSCAASSSHRHPRLLREGPKGKLSCSHRNSELVCRTCGCGRAILPKYGG